MKQKSKLFSLFIVFVVASVISTSGLAIGADISPPGNLSPILGKRWKEAAMTKLESITDIRNTSFHVRMQADLTNNDESLQKLYTAHEQLLDRFYAENEDMMIPSQYRAAKWDLEYFMRLVDLAYHYYLDRGSNAGPMHLDG
jgi:hypothetical protein